MNFDQSEVEKFDQLARHWWDPKGPMRPLHRFNPLRLQYISQRVVLAGKKVLDVGCGGGLLSEAMASESAIVTGIDLSESLIEVAQHHADKKRIRVDYQRAAAETMAQSHYASFDLVTCMELLEHVSDPLALIKACADCLKVGGLLFVSTLNRSVKSYLTAIVGAEYILGLLPKGTHEYAKFIRPSELSAWSRQAGLTLKDLQGVRYQLLSDVFCLSRDVSVNYLACYEK